MFMLSQATSESDLLVGEMVTSGVADTPAAKILARPAHGLDGTWLHLHHAEFSG